MTKLQRTHSLVAEPVAMARSSILSGAVKRMANDFRFEVTGGVATNDAGPPQGAEVTREVTAQVYEGVELVKTRKLQTNGTSGFVFSRNTDERGGRHALTVRKEGFEPKTVSGIAPPPGHHTIILKKPIEP